LLKIQVVVETENSDDRNYGGMELRAIMA
jgi:hypothetical protein